MWTIRPEEPCDYEQIRDMIIAAFSAAYGTGALEADLVESLRVSRAHDPGLALVAVRGDEVLGHVMLSPVTIRDDSGYAWSALVLAPLGVRIGHQRQGIGSALMLTALAAARERGHMRVVLSGSPEYYERFGFEDAVHFKAARRIRHARTPLSVACPLQGGIFWCDGYGDLPRVVGRRA